MKFLALVSVASGLVAAAPVVEKIAAREPLLGASVGVNLGSSSAPLLGVGLSSSTLLAVVVTVPKSSSVKSSSAAITTKASSAAVATSVKVSSTLSTTNTAKVSSSAKPSTMATTVAPVSSATYATALPSTFSAPVQGQGVLSLENLPALPGVIDKTFSGALGAAYGLLSGACNTQYMCSITVAGTLPSLLVNGGDYGTATTIQAWCDAGRCYGGANPTISGTSPYTVTCTYITGTQACSATISGAARAIFTNGQQVELWGWITPAGYCQAGVCTASIKAFGDPMY